MGLTGRFWQVYDEIVAEIAAHDPLADEQARQLREGGAPVPEQQAAAYGKVELAKFVFGGRERGIEDPSEGQVVMAKMLAKKGEGGALEARPAGFAMAVVGGDLRNGDRGEFFNVGAMVLTSGVIVDGKLGYVAADKEEVFLIRAGTYQPKDRRLRAVQISDAELERGMCERFDSAGRGSMAEGEGQIVNFRLNMAHPRDWPGVEIVRLDGEDAEKALVEAARESERAPFISTVDAKTRPLEDQGPQQPAQRKLSEVKF